MNSLRSIIESAARIHKASLADLTALSTQNDPYRLDTPANHRNGQWVAEQIDRLYGDTGRLHWRGLHYAIISSGAVTKPNGDVYINTDENWFWVSEVAGKASRWLGYVPFERIRDQRNAAPVIHRKEYSRPFARLSVGIDVDIPGIDDLDPTPMAYGFDARQAYHFVIFGEKSSLEDIVKPVAAANHADLYLPTGEISDTLVYQIASDAARDGRPLVLFTLSDCDPAGHQMPVSIARKLQAFRDMFFPSLTFEVVRIGLTPEQVREFDLPETPLKEGEKRAARWKEAFGVEQTEIDALTTPAMANVLQNLIRQAFEPYIDRTLFSRVRHAKSEWQERAQEALAEQIDGDHLASIRTQAEARLEELREEIERINEQLNISADDIRLPPINVPQAEIELAHDRRALVALEDDWTTATRKMRRHKAYGREPA